MSDVVDGETCNECGAEGWREYKSAEISYPEHRSRDRDKTTRRVFICKSCGSEGRVFEDGQHGTIQLTGALR